MKNEVTIITHAAPRATAVDSRLYSVTDASKMHVFASAQRTITYRALHQLGKPSTIAEIAAVADTLGLKSKTPTTDSVRYHLVYLVKDGYVIV